MSTYLSRFLEAVLQLLSNVLETNVVVATVCYLSGKSLDPVTLVHSAASNIICSVLFGHRYDYQDPVLSFVINSFKENAQIANGPWAAVSYKYTQFNLYCCIKRSQLLHATFLRSNVFNVFT